jgi:hypothetical protein
LINMPGAAVIFIAVVAAAGSAPSAPPDIELNARAQIRELRIEQQGKARISLRAEPLGGDNIAVERNLPKGERRYRNLDIKLSAEARLAAPAERDRSQQGE